jgi:hypothetical protein
LLLALLEESFLAFLLLALLSCEVLVSSYLINLLLIDAGQINLVRGCNNIASINSSERNAVDLEWSGNEKNTL